MRENNFFRRVGKGLVLIFLLGIFLSSAEAEASYFSDDFESGLGKWEVSEYDWALIDTDSRSQTHSATDSPNGNYLPNANASLTLAHQIDLTGSTSPVLSFWYKISMACYTNCNYWDQSYLEVSTDGGFKWTTLKSYIGVISTWQHELIDLSSYKTSSILIRFRVQAIGGDGDGWYIDDVEIKEKDSARLSYPFSDDFESGLSKWEVSGYDWALIDTDSRSQTHSVTDSPDGNYLPSANASLTLAHQIDLTGSTSPVLSFWYKISMACYTNCNYWDQSYLEVSTDGGFKWTTLKSYIGVISTWQHELIDLSSYKTSSILIRFRVQAIGGDGDGWYIDDVEIKEKDSATSINVFISPAGGGTVTGEGISCPGDCSQIYSCNWIVSGHDWDVTTSDSRSATHSVTDSPDGNYLPSANASLTLAHQIDLTGSTSPVLSFWYKISMACYTNCNYWDQSYLEVSTDGGFKWTTLKSYIGVISTWQHELIDLSSYKTSSILIRFRVQAIGGDGDGWYIDDVEIKELSGSISYFFDNFESENSLCSVDLTATPDLDFNCTKWIGCATSVGNQCTATTDFIDRIVRATFILGYLGDINSECVVDISDVILVLRCALGLSVEPYQCMPCGDINGDGKVDISDVILTLRTALKLDPLKECTE